mmetsp:Transcript_21744/g.61840  ORF Transcript_21744/g.61840 Transcript_21744/m.61840 type:complete len:289 (-) Transcript_21744:1603-2469(-)
MICRRFLEVKDSAAHRKSSQDSIRIDSEGDEEEVDSEDDVDRTRDGDEADLFGDDDAVHEMNEESSLTRRVIADFTRRCRRVVIREYQPPPPLSPTAHLPAFRELSRGRQELHLTPMAEEIFRRLFAVRDDIARTRDEPPESIVPNQLLFEWSVSPPLSRAAFIVDNVRSMWTHSSPRVSIVGLLRLYHAIGRALPARDRAQRVDGQEGGGSGDGSAGTLAYRDAATWTRNGCMPHLGHKVSSSGSWRGSRPLCSSECGRCQCSSGPGTSTLSACLAPRSPCMRTWRC